MNRTRGTLLRGTLAAVALLARGALAGPAPAAYVLDPAHSSVTFTFVQAGARNVGRFRAFSATFDPGQGRLEVLIDLRAADTGDGERNRMLAGKSFFDVARYPQARFESTRVVQTAGGYQAQGTLSLRGVTRPITVAFTWRTHLQGGRRIGELEGTTVVPRLEYGVGAGQWRATTWLGNRVTVRYALTFLAH